MTMHFSDIVSSVKAKGSVSPADIAAFRQRQWNNGRVSRIEADLLFEMNDGCHHNDSSWEDCFIEAIVAHVIENGSPRGYIDDATAGWLMARIDHDGKLDSRTELEILVRMLEKAMNAPVILKDYALRQIEQAVMTGDGVTRGGKDQIRPGVVDPVEVEYLRRLLYSSGGDGPARISQNEAELLFRIKDATLGNANAPEWQNLFVQCVGNYLMAYASYEAMSIDRAREIEAFMDAPARGVSGFLRAMGKFEFGKGLQGLFEREPETDDHTALVNESRKINPRESEWLEARLAADGKLDAMEDALMKFIAKECGHPLD